MTFGEMQTDLQRILATDLGYYAGDEDRDSATVDFDVVRNGLLNWAYRTTTKLCYIVEPALTFEPVAEQAMYSLQESPGMTQIIDIGAATGGTYTLAYNGSAASAAIQWDASANDVLTALNGLSTINPAPLATVTVTAVANGFSVAFATTSPPYPLMTMASSLTGTTTTPAVRQVGFQKRCVKVFDMWLAGTQSRTRNGRPGLYNRTAFERWFQGWRDADSGTPYFAVDRGSSIQLYPTPDSAYVLSSSAANWAQAQVLHDDMVADLDGPELPEETHEGMVLLAAFRATDPVLDEDGALRRMGSANARWTAEVMEIRHNNKNAMVDTSNRYQQGDRVRT